MGVDEAFEFFAHTDEGQDLTGHVLHLDGFSLGVALEAERQDLAHQVLGTLRGPQLLFVDIRFVDDFPMTVTGKIQKFVMRDTMIKDLGITIDKTA